MWLLKTGVALSSIFLTCGQSPGAAPVLPAPSQVLVSSVNLLSAKHHPPPPTWRVSTLTHCNMGSILWGCWVGMSRRETLGLLSLRPAKTLVLLNAVHNFSLSLHHLPLNNSLHFQVLYPPISLPHYLAFSSTFLVVSSSLL